MAYSITQFANSPGPDLLSALDNNFTTFGALVSIPCAVNGVSTLNFIPNSGGNVPTPTLSAYNINMIFTGIAGATNPGSVTVNVGSLPALNVYKDTASGPALLTGGEIVALNAISLRYDPALNSGAGGFHLASSTANTGLPIPVGNSTLTNLSSGNSPTLTFTATPGWSSQDQTFSVTAALASALPAVGDFVQVNPPSLGATGVGYSGYVLGVGSISSVASAATINIRLLNAASASLASNSGIYRWAATRLTP